MPGTDDRSQDITELTPRQLHERGLAWLASAIGKADGAAAEARIAQGFFIASVSASALADDEDAGVRMPYVPGPADSHGMVPRGGY